MRRVGSRCDKLEVVLVTRIRVDKHGINNLNPSKSKILNQTWDLIVKSPLLSTSPPSIRAEWLPNCIARFFLMLASTSPTFLAASLNNNLSPIPTSNRGSSFRCTGSPARNDTTESERNGCLVSLPCEDIIRSSRPRLRVGMRSSSSWSWSTKVFTAPKKRRARMHAPPQSRPANPAS